MNIIMGMKILWIFFGGSSQNWTSFRGQFYALYCLFLRSRYRKELFLWGVKVSNIFWGMLDIPDICLVGLTGDAGSKPTYQEKLEFFPVDKCLNISTCYCYIYSPIEYNLTKHSF